MSDTTFQTGTIITDTWLNEINDFYHTLFAAATTAAAARTALGLDTMATQAASAVAITGGTVTGITDITVADGGTGRSTATAFAVLCGGTTATGAHQSVASVGTSGQVLTSNGAGNLPTFQTKSIWTIVNKTANESVADTTLQDDDHLLFAVLQDTYYAYRMFLQYTTTATADFKFILNISSSTEHQGIVTASDGTTVSALPVALGTEVSVTGGGTVSCLEVRGTFLAGSAGNFSLAWAQNTDDGANQTTVLQGSFVEYQIIGV